MSALHSYAVTVEWTGSGGTGTTAYTAYSRDHLVHVGQKAVLECSADPAFRGDPLRLNPEELFVSSLAQCHMLWFLHMASVAGVVVVGYSDRALGTMRVDAVSGHGRFVDVVLSPQVTVSGHSVNEELLARLHRDAHDRCFLARSVSFPVLLRPLPAERATQPV